MLTKVRQCKKFAVLFYIAFACFSYFQNISPARSLANIYIYIYVCVFALLSPVFNFYSSPEYEGNTILRDIENYVFTSLYGVKSDKIHHNYHQQQQQHYCDK